MLKFLLGLLSGPLSDISNDLKEAYQSKLDAKNNSERIAADERIALLESRRATILAAQSDRYERFVRIGFAFPFIAYVNKLVLWDKVLGWGVTDGLSPELYQIMMIVLGGYFVDTIVKRVVKKG